MGYIWVKIQPTWSTGLGEPTYSFEQKSLDQPMSEVIDCLNERLPSDILYNSEGFRGFNLTNDNPPDQYILNEIENNKNRIIGLSTINDALLMSLQHKNGDNNE